MMKQRILFLLFFVAISIALLIGELRPFVLETATLTPFLTTQSFCLDTIAKVCGLVFYVASFFQSCFACPWLGTCLFSLLLVCLYCVVRWALRVKQNMEGLCWLPSIALLLNYTQTGYMIYLLKSTAIAFTPVVGMMFAMLLVGLWARIQKQWERILWIFLVSSLGFWAMGFWALLASVIVALMECQQFGLDKTNWKRLMLILGILVFAFLMPRILYSFGFFMVNEDALYSIGLPDYLWNESERRMFYPLIFSCVWICGLALIRLVRFPKWVGWCSFLVMGAALFGVWKFSFKDESFLTILKMKQAAQMENYEEILSLSRSLEHEPTRTEVMFTRLALFKTDQMGEGLFRYRDGDAEYVSPRPFQYMRAVAARTLYYLYGKVNFAYRWSMEDMVEYGHRPDYLMCMAKCSLLNGESRLATKYLDELSNTLWYRGFAEKYKTYVKQPKLVRQVKEMGKIFPLLQYKDVLDGDGGLIEMYLLNSFAYSEGGSRQLVELSLMNNMIMKNLNAALPRFGQLLPTWKGNIPRHYQELALLLGQLSGGRVDISSLPISKEVKMQFDELIQLSAQNGDDATNAQALFPKFGGTYWYYYFFINGLKTT